MEKNNYLLPVIGFEEAIMTKGKGSYVYDSLGKEYLDLNSGQFCTILGHSNQEFLDTVKEKMNDISHTSSNIITDEVVKFSKEMYRISGDMKGYSISLSTGAEAVEFCIRYAKAITKKNGLVCFDKGYHGLTLGAQSITYAGYYTKPHIDEIYSVPAPDTFCNESELRAAIIQAKKIIEMNSEDIAAVVMEPIVSVGGMIIPQKQYFQEIRKICDENEILLIFDECQTGFGRTGSWFLYQQLDVIPDMVAVAKGIGNGYPVSAVMINEKVVLQYDFAMTHYSSHQNDSFAASIVNAGIKYIEKYKLLDNVKVKGDYFLQKLKELSSKTKYIVKPRGQGLMLGVDLYFEDIQNYRSIYKFLYHNMTEKGIIIQGTNGGRTLRFLPDYLIKEEDIDKTVNTLYEVIETELVNFVKSSK